MAPASFWWSLVVACYGLASLASLTLDVHQQRSYRTARLLLLRLTAFIFAANFASVATQALGLIGPRGIQPLSATLQSITENLAYRDRKGLVTPRTSRLMSGITVWIWSAWGLGNVRAAAWCGCALGGFVVVTVASLNEWAVALAFALLYLCWYAYKRALGPFANLQWDMLLLEIGILCTLLAAAPGRIGTIITMHLIQACVIRLHCGAGIAKLTSGDRRWAELSAMEVHHETQPLPTPLAPHLHALPPWCHRASTLAALMLELGTVIACVPLPHMAEAAFIMVVLVQGAIVTSGSFGFFNAFSVVLSLSFLEDQSCFIPAALHPVHTPSQQLASAAVSACLLTVAAPTAAVLFLARAAKYTEGRCRYFSRVDPWLRTAEMTFCFANRFSLFSNMVESRHEIVLEGTDDGVVWTEYELKYGVDRCDRLKFVPPFHMPRLCWRLWLLAQGRPGADWFDTLLERLLEGAPDVVALFAGSPEACPRLAVRGRRYQYRFTKRGECGRWVRSEPAQGGSFFGMPMKRKKAD